MTYSETLSFLYNKTPLFQQIGTNAYKEGLSNMFFLDEEYNHPHKSFKTIHVGGTNGKGSVSHTLAAILQCSGYKVGLYTSPHLKDFSERIRVNGKPISQNFVINFVEQGKELIEKASPSFFEFSTMMAFCYFKQKKIDVAIIEVGLGGRLDSTNIISPELSIITNISFDHTNLLGDTLEKIAIEKAGIIKENIPVVIGETTQETQKIFASTALIKHSEIYFSEKLLSVEREPLSKTGKTTYQTNVYENLTADLGGLCQIKNTATILTAVTILQTKETFRISKEAVYKGFKNVTSITGLRGRWQILQKKPLIVADTAHNEAGIKYVVEQLENLPKRNLHMVIGMVNDKNHDAVLKLLPKKAQYYFTKANIPRALEPDILQKKAKDYGLSGNVFMSVKEAFKEAKRNANPLDIIFIGGSTFVVAEAL